MRTAAPRSSARGSRGNLAAVLFGAYRRQVLGLLLLRPDEHFYVREIERLTGVPAGSLHRELRLLTDAGLLMRTASGNQVLYQAIRTCPIFEELAGIFRKTAGLADVLREALEPLADGIEFAMVFGSVARGEESSESDVDVLVVGRVAFSTVVAATSTTQPRLMREVNPVVMSAQNFRAKRTGKDRFITRILAEPRIMLMGSLEAESNEPR